MIAAGLLCFLLAGVSAFLHTNLPGSTPALLAVDGALAALGLALMLGGRSASRKHAHAMQEAAEARRKAEAMAERIGKVDAERGRLAGEVADLRREVDALEAQYEEKLRALKVKAEVRPEAIDAELVAFLSLLQRKGRFVDFLMDDIARYDDAQIGAAARVVHQGCSEVLKDCFDIVPIRGDEEGKMVVLNDDYRPERYRLVGRVSGSAPFRGTLLHRGWRTNRVALPRVASPTTSSDVIAPAEVELN